MLLESITNNQIVSNISVTRRSYVNLDNPSQGGIPTTEIDIYVDSDLIELKELKATVDNRVMVLFNDNPQNTPFTHNRFSIESTKHFISVKGKGWEVLFDGSKLYITVDPIFQDNTRGLCGTYNFNSADDFTSPQGFIETDILDFTDSYKSDSLSQNCQSPYQFDPCEDLLSEAQTAHAKCSVFNNDIFNECKEIVNFMPFQEACLYDLCADTAENYRNFYFCNAIQAYTFECANKGIIIEWHNSTDPQLVDLQQACSASHSHECPTGSYYTECSRTEDASCEDISRPHNYHSSFTCHPGCSCPAGEYFEVDHGELKCIPKAQCPCYSHETHRVYTPGQRFDTLCTSCECKNGLYSCSELPCENVQCMNNQVFSKNATACPKTCYNKDHHHPCTRTVETCTCPEGTILDFNQTCVTEASCPCKHAGKLYGNSESISIGCNTW